MNKISKIGFGTGKESASQTDDHLTDPYYIKNIDSHLCQDGQAIFSWILESSEFNDKQITELGLYCNDGSTLFARKVRSPIQKQEDIYLIGKWTIIF